MKGHLKNNRGDLDRSILRGVDSNGSRREIRKEEVAVDRSPVTEDTIKIIDTEGNFLSE